MKIPYIAFLALFGALALLVGGGRAEAYIGYGYRANETVRVDRCYRGYAWNYAVPFYLYGSKNRYSRNGCCCRR